MPRIKTNRGTSWAASYAQQSDLLDIQLRSNYQHKLIQDEIAKSDERSEEYKEELKRAALERKMFAEDPEGYLSAKQYENTERKSGPWTLRDTSENEEGNKSGPWVSDIEAKANKKPEGNYWKNAWNFHGKRMNEFQIEAATGYINRTQKWLELAQGYLQSLSLEDRIKGIDKTIKEAEAQPITSQEELLSVNQWISDLLYEKEQLIAQHKELEGVRKAFDTYIPSGIKSRYYDLVAGNADEEGILNRVSNVFANNPIFGRTTQMHDEMGDFLRFTSGMYAKGTTPERKKEILQTALNASNEKIKEWQHIAEENIKDREYYAQQLDPDYEAKFTNAPTDFFDRRTWMYGLPGLIAGTTSSSSKILPQMLIAAVTGGGSLGVQLGGFTVAAGLGIAAGIEENNAEVANAYSEQVKQYLQSQKGQGDNSLYDDIIKEGRQKLEKQGLKNLTDDQVFERFQMGFYGSNNATVNKKLQELARGIESQFQDDMMATSYGSLIETALMSRLNPLGRLMKVPRTVKYGMMSSQKGRKLLRAVSPDIARGFTIGTSLGATLGPIGTAAGALYAPVHAMIKPAAKRVGKYGKQMIDDIGRTAAVTDFVPEKVFTKKFLSEPTKKYIKGVGNAMIVEGISEGIEEGKQGISANKYKSGEYTTDEIKSMSETILDDFLAGSHAASLILGMPFGEPESEKDRELLREIKGGMIMGMLQTGSVRAVTDYVPYRREITAREAIVNTVLSDKANKIDALNKALIYAERSKSATSYQSILNAFDTMRLKNEEEKKISGEYAIDPKAIDQEEEEFKRVAKMATDPYTIKQALNQGVKYGTQDYNEFVSAKAFAQNRVNEEEEVLNLARDSYNARLDEVANSVLTRQLERMSAVVPGVEEEQREESTEFNPSLLLSGFDDYARSRNVAEYSALLKRKQELILGIDNAIQSGKDRVKDLLNKQLTNVESRINLMKPVVSKYIQDDQSVNLDDVNSVETNLAFDKNTHDELTDLYRQVLLAQDDYDLAVGQYEDIVGKAYLDDKEITRDTEYDVNEDFDRITFSGGKAKTILNQIREMYQDDDNFVSAIQEDFDNRTDDEGNEIISPEEEQAIEETVPQNDPEEEFRQEVMEASKKPYVTPTIEVREKPVEPILKPSEPLSPVQPTVVPETPQTLSETPKNDIAGKTINGITYSEPLYVRFQSRFEDKLGYKRWVGGDVIEAKYTDIKGNQVIEVFDYENGTAKENEFAFDYFPKKYAPARAQDDWIVSGKEIAGYNKLTIDKNNTVYADIVYVHRDGHFSNEKNVPLTSSVYSNPFTTWSVLHTTEEQHMTPQQLSVIDELKKRSEASKQYVISVDSEFYTIKVGEQEIKMPRVHSVMPKYWFGDGNYKAPLQLGNAFDNLARIFFGDINNIARYEQNPDAFVESLFDMRSSEDTSNPNAVNRTYRTLYDNKEAFANTIRDLYELAKQYRDLGWALSTDKIVWYSQFESGYVAGETDMLAVDRDGNIHIIDFKTAKGLRPFLTYVNDDVYRTNKYKDLLDTLTEDDFKAGPNKKALSKAAKAVKRNIRVSEGNNKNIMLAWQDGHAVIKYADSEFTNNKFPLYRRGTKQQEYSDQLTAYAEMIQKQIANVVDLEIVGFRTSYTTDPATNLSHIQALENQVNGKPFRIKVDFSDEMRSILNNEGTPIQPVEQENKEVVESKESAESQQQAQQQEAKANDTIVPKKSPDSLTRPTEPAPVAHENLGYSNMNNTAIKNDPELAKLTAAPDFINEAIQQGLVEVYTEDVKERNGTNNYVYADIHYNGKTYKRIYIWANPQLHAKVRSLEQNKQPGQRIVATALKRTAGELKLRQDGQSVPLTETTLLSGLKLQDIEFTAEQGTFGFVHNGDVVSYANGETTQPRIIYSYKGGQRQAPANGTILHIKNPNHKENPNEAIPVGINRKTFKDSAEFIIQCLREFNAIDNPYLVTVNGQQKSLGVSRKRLLSLLMPIVNNEEQADSYSIKRDQNNPSVFYIVQRGVNGFITAVNTLDEQSVNNFRQFLNNAQMAIDNRTLVSRIGEDNNKTPQVFKDIKRFFGQNAGINSIRITDDLKFDREDILGKGLSGLGWYIKTGRLITNYEDIVAPLVSIGDVGYQGELQNTAQDQVKSVEEQIQSPIEDDDVLDILFKKRSKKDENKPKLTEEQIKKNLRPILGDEVDNPAVVQIITNMATDPRFSDAAVVGIAHNDGIRIYSAATEGVEYHEAFHRIFELYVPAQLRDKIYNQTAKQLELNLSKDSEENNWSAHRMIAEDLADKYLDYKTGEFKSFGILNNVFNKIRDYANAYFRISNRQLYKVFLDINSGKYRSERRKNNADVERFKKLFGNLNYEIRGEEFKWIINDPMYEQVKNTAFYCMMLGQKIDLSGKSVSETEISRKVFMKGAERILKQGIDVLGTQVDPEFRSPGQLAMAEAYVKFDAVADDIAAMFAAVSTDYKKVRFEEKQEEQDGDEESIASSYDENFFKWDYEFDRFDKTSSRVKYFFSAIPDMKYDENGNVVLQRNDLGMPQLLPMKYVFNEVMNALWDVDTLDELVSRTKKLTITDPMWGIISANLDELIRTRVDQKGKVDADKEALLTQLMNTIRSNKNAFMVTKAKTNQDGTYTITMQTSDADYNAREYPIQWSQILSKGGSDILKVNKNGQLIFNPKNPEAAIAFQKISRLFDFSRIDKTRGIEYVGLKQMLSEAPSANRKVMVLWDILGTEEYQFLEYSDAELARTAGDPKRTFTTRSVTDLNDPKQLKKVKNAIVEALNTIGINIHTEEFDYMLRNKYGSTDTDALRQMVNSTDSRDSMSSFLYFLNTISNGKQLNIAEDGTVALQRNGRVKFENIYEKLAFVKELGNWKYQYRHAHDELNVLALHNDRYYQMSDNDLFSDMMRALNKRGQWFEDLKQDAYNYFVSQPDANGDVKAYGSYILDQLTKNPDLKLTLSHPIGLKTDKRGDEGSDYFEIKRKEDYLSKLAMLENGAIISLTLSDKKKYVNIHGIKLPGLDYSTITDSEGNVLINMENATQKAHSMEDGGIDQLDSVVSQFLSYAMSEYQSILHASLNEVDVANYKKQGKMFSSLLGVWEITFDQEGKREEKYVSFNNNKKSWQENLTTAEQHFFSKPEEIQKALIKNNLNKILEKELKTAEELGLIEIVGTNKNAYLNYKNKGLNNTAIQSLKQSYMAKYQGVDPQIAESIAIVMYLNDMSNKAIMSGQEMERLFSGNPAFYKWKYNDKGELVDRTTDELKRLGGIGSTGTNNFLELANLPEKYKDGKYRCAEVDNEEVASPQLEMLQTTMYEGELRQNVIYDRLAREKAILDSNHDQEIKSINNDKLLDEEEKQAAIIDAVKRYLDDLEALRRDIADEVDNSSIEQLELAYKGSELLKLSKEKAAVSAKSFAGKIDVADGGAYISDEMCEILLRMEGSYSKEIEEAFDILRGKKKADYLGKSEAYQKVLTTVIGNQKYTAFGRRLQNGTSIPYYHKMALFPIFDCIATGKMGNIFDKMKEQQIDMLLVNSAVKVGSQGSKAIEWSTFREDDNAENKNNFAQDKENGWSWKPTFQEAFNFDTYDVDFTYLRKLLNTDPKGEEMLRMGTQAQKIIFSNMLHGREYTTQSGEKIRGQELQNRIMDSMNKMSDLGVKDLNQRFFVTNENGQLIDEYGDIIDDPNSNRRQIDIEKFAKEVSRLMSSRGADKNVMKALEVITNSTTNDKQLAIPLGAISNASWLESVLVSMINKDVVDVNTPGAFFIQRSVWGMQGQRMYSRDKGNILGRQIYNGKRLQMINEEGSMDCVLSLDYFEHILPMVESEEYELDEDGNYVYVEDGKGGYKTDKYGNYIAKKKMRKMSFDEARQWLLDNGIIGGKSNIIAYRIPTQAQSSIHALRCVDVLPVVRDTVILPEEFTKITGSDFDQPIKVEIKLL